MMMDSLRGYWTSLKVLAAFVKYGKNLSGHYDELALVGEDNAHINLDVYYPQKKSLNKLIVCCHGLHPDGRREARLSMIAAILAHMGYTVVLPDFPLLRNLSMREDSLQEVEKVMQVIKASPFVTTYAKIGIFTVCYATPGVLFSLSRDNDAGFADALITVGGCFNPAGQFYRFDNDDFRDEYARAVIIRNFCPDYQTADQKMQAGMDRIIQDTVLENDYATINDFLITEELSVRQRNVLNSWVRKIKNQESMFTESPLRSSPELHAFLQQQYHHAVNAFNLPAALIHGLNDGIFSAVETANFQQALAARGIKNRMVLTRLMEHANIRLRWNTMIGGIKLLDTIAFFFRQLA